MNKNKANIRNNCTILVLSCDKYSDLWEPFFGQFWKYWPDCSYPVVLGSNTVDCKNRKVKTILSGPDRDWSTSLRAILNQIHTPYVFIWLDDMFPIHDVATSNFVEAQNFMVRYKARHMHIEPIPKPDSVVDGGRYGAYAPGAPYRATVFGFWEVRYLFDLLLPGENPWNFEIMGSYRSRYADGFYCSMKPLFKRLHVVEKGRIFQEAYEYCVTHSIPLDTEKREVLSHTTKMQSQIQIVIFNTVIRIPWKLRLSIMNILRKLLISY